MCLVFCHVLRKFLVLAKLFQNRYICVSIKYNDLLSSERDFEKQPFLSQK